MRNSPTISEFAVNSGDFLRGNIQHGNMAMGDPLRNGETIYEWAVRQFPKIGSYNPLDFEHCSNGIQNAKDGNFSMPYATHQSTQF